MGIPNLLLLFERFRHTREGLVQMILASQLIGEVPAKWNTPYPLGTFGRELLRAIYATRFQIDLSLAEAEVYWECNICPQGEEARWPDLAVWTKERMILFELKTEAGSIREGQVDEYLTLCRRNFPSVDVDMIYITTDRIDSEPASDPRSRYSNLTWAEVSELERSIPGPIAAGERMILEMCCDYLGELQRISNRRSGMYKARRQTQPALKSQPEAETTVPERTPLINEEGLIDLEAILQVFRTVESTGKQEAVDLPCESPKDAYRVLREIDARIGLSNPQAAVPILHTRGWVWTPQSRGAAMTESGRTHGVEIRVSRHQKAQRA
jgi:hypothetical protein